MGPVYGTEIGLAVDRTALFIAMAALFGGLVLQWPIGWLSDRFDRRKVIVAAAWVATFASTRRRAWAANRLVHVQLVGLDRAAGGHVDARCTRCAARTRTTISHHATNRRSECHPGPGRREWDSRWVPLLAADPDGRLRRPRGAVRGCSPWFTAASVRYGLYRMVRRDPVPLDEQRSYQPVSLRTSPIVQAATTREWRDARDRDLARWSKLVRAWLRPCHSVTEPTDWPRTETNAMARDHERRDD